MTTKQAATNYRWRRAMWRTRKLTPADRWAAPSDTASYVWYVETNYALAKLRQVYDRA